jgi:hypothetical protein
MSWFITAQGIDGKSGAVPGAGQALAYQFPSTMVPFAHLLQARQNLAERIQVPRHQPQAQRW